MLVTSLWHLVYKINNVMEFFFEGTAYIFSDFLKIYFQRSI